MSAVLASFMVFTLLCESKQNVIADWRVVPLYKGVGSITKCTKCSKRHTKSATHTGTTYHYTTSMVHVVSMDEMIY